MKYHVRINCSNRLIRSTTMLELKPWSGTWMMTENLNKSVVKKKIELEIGTNMEKTSQNWVVQSFIKLCQVFTCGLPL